jgi:hypothetical protein
MIWLRILMGALAIFAMPLLPSASPSLAADPSCPVGTTPSPMPGGGSICVPASDPGGGGTTTPGEEQPGYSTGTALCSYQGQQIPCVTSAGTWFASQECYAQPMDPQPSADSPLWNGHPPEEGQVWVCVNRAGPFTSNAFFFVPNGETPALIDPADVAANAVDQMDLAVPEVHLAPGPPGMTFVGLRTWLWIDPSQWRSLVLTVTAGGTTVAVRAHPVRVSWDLTAGLVACDSPGRPWRAGMSSQEETDCFFTFDSVSDSRPGDRFPVTATLTYQVDWTCSGACLAGAGSLGEVDSLPGQTAIRVGERQSVVVQ